ncbi:hypothetical protein NEPAR04_2412 [Nematocida parisii]|nr:hypothetical protein NEPAR08_2409 [Nematocida parisii]KAI5131273.1 hypothetical protein NEPAR03_2370 [Nematocida parisii]KAI5145303.1 hypothetical protein NEPAR04_2412 [Nematocida parisii]
MRNILRNILWLSKYFCTNYCITTQNISKLFILCLLYSIPLYRVACRLSIDSLYALQYTPIPNIELHNAGGLFINESGSLNLLRGYIYCTPEMVKILHDRIKLEKERIEKMSVCNRDYLGTSNSIDKRYLLEYIHVFNILFPSYAIPGYPENQFSEFKQFLLQKNNGAYILAMLFLLSEGVEINIGINHVIGGNNMTSESDDFSRVAVLIYQRDLQIIGVESGYIKDIINFFKNSNKHACFSSMIAEKNDFIGIKDINANNFMLSPKYLIQMYLWEYFENETDVFAFYNEVYRKIKSYSIEHTKNQRTTSNVDIKSLYCDIFISKEKICYSFFTEEFYSTFKTICQPPSPIPFSIKYKKPFNYMLPGIFSPIGSKEPLMYNTCSMSTCLFVLLSCFLYSPKKGTFLIYDMPKDYYQNKTELLNCFTPPSENTKNALYEWNRFLASTVFNKRSMHDSSINRYLKATLKGGIFNLFDLLSKIVNISNINLNILNLLKTLSSPFDVIPIEVTSQINTFIHGVFSDLTMDIQERQVFTSLSEVKKLPTPSGEYDLFGTLAISYIYNDIQSSIVIDMHPCYTYTFLLPEKRICNNNTNDLINSSIKAIPRNSMFIHSLIKHYLNLLSNSIKREIGEAI